ncbi:hypothetical protein AAGS40_18250 [Paraburkholderia sp. PREW-6R]|uniref:hypothetical protein n=1 Tax=Paraburkholderia sp. PREW-6R TaxID=3141544 RepID=UPI0031F55D2A
MSRLLESGAATVVPFDVFRERRQVVQTIIEQTHRRCFTARMTLRRVTEFID